MNYLQYKQSPVKHEIEYSNFTFFIYAIFILLLSNIISASVPKKESEEELHSRLGFWV